MSNPFEDTLKTWVEVFLRHSMRNLNQYIKEQGLSMSQMGALFYIHRKGAIGVSDLGEEQGVTSAAASQMLDRLVQQGMVSRSEDPHDRRLKQIVLTELGAQILHQGIMARQTWLIDLVSSLPPSEQQQVLPALQILIEKANMQEPAIEPIPSDVKE